MIYCKECSKNSFCYDMRKTDETSIDCHKYVDRDYHNYSRDKDCDSVTFGTFGEINSLSFKLNRDSKYRDVEICI